MKTYLSFLFLLAFTFSNAQINLGGEIAREDGTPIENVPVFISGDVNGVAFTNSDGIYQFTVPQGGTYEIEPKTNNEPYNGVSTFDIVLISKHVDEIESLDSPYKIIAADVNSSGLVDMVDTADLVSLVLGQIGEFPNTPSWQFVDADFVFPDASNPFASAYPTAFITGNADADVTDIDFVAIKTGDVNYSAVASLELDPCEYSCGHISGKVIFDEDESCSIATEEATLEDWVITAVSSSYTYQTTTNQFGLYTIPAFPGDYTVTLTPPNSLWTACELSTTVALSENQDFSYDFLAQAVGDWPAVEVDIATPFLRRCFESFYVIQYCNQGTIPAEDASIEVTFDPYLTLTNSSVTPGSQVDNTYTFDLGDLAINECGIINVEVSVSCDAVLGQTFCSEAHAFPDSLCAPLSPLWDGSSLELTGNCEGDEVNFQIKNTGLPMTEAVNYIIIEDDMIMNVGGGSDPVMLGAQETKEVQVPANGSTWRMELEQSSEHPLSELISSAVEGCGVNSEGEFSLGFITQFPQLTYSGAVDVDCTEGIGSWDPNDKAAKPEGVGSEHFIERNADIEYKIRFQNTGTDTAFNVVILDTIAIEYLDLTSIRSGASSHPYTFDLLGENVVEFRFSNIMLPDSNVNEVASHGFVQFKIEQNVNNELGEVIENNAAIYFDFNEPVITNTVFHTLGENFLEIVDNVSEPYQTFEIKIAPNPVSTSATLTLDGLDLQNGSFILYDLYGRQLQQYDFTGNSLEFFKNQLTSGLYLFEIREGTQKLSSGKIMVK